MATQRRTVEIMIDDEELDITQNKVNVEKAIGYLATWAIGSDRYLNVRIYSCRDRELNAVYTNGKGERTYVMGAIEREDGDYSFHS